MTLEELKMGEHDTVEYKQDIPGDKDKYLKTAVAFANAAGGQIIFGVENNTWNVTGFSNDEVFAKMDAITNSIFDACEPSVVPIMEIEEIDGKKIIVATIRPGMAKPYYLRKDGMMDGTYIRIAGVTRKAEPYMIKELQLEGTGASFDALQVFGEISDDEIGELCDRMYQHALDRCQTEDQRAEQKKVTVSQLVSWKILGLFNGKCYPTNAWNLLTNPSELFPDAVIQLAVFKGNTRAVFLDRKTATGPIDQQIEEAMHFVKRNIRLGSRIAGVYREDIYELPIDSIREMISNAVCHRSYVSPGSIQVAIYDDRLEVTSPGRISPDLTMEQLIAGNSRVRNVAIGAAFQYMHIIEKWGTGIPRIYKEAKEYGLREPELKDFGTSFRISIYRKEAETDAYGVVGPEAQSSASNEAQYETESKSSASSEAQHEAESKSSASNETQLTGSASDGSKIEALLLPLPEPLRMRGRMIISAIMTDPQITASQIGKNNGLSRATIQRAIDELKKVNILTHEGSNNGGHWVVHWGRFD